MHLGCAWVIWLAVRCREGSLRTGGAAGGQWCWAQAPSWTPSPPSSLSNLGFCSKRGKEAEMGPGEGKAHWKKGSKAAPPEPWGLPATGVVSGLQEATCPRSLLCGPGPLPQPPIPGTNDCSLNIFPLIKPSGSPSGQQSLLSQAWSAPTGRSSGCPACRAPSGLGRSRLHLAGQQFTAQG